MSKLFSELSLGPLTLENRIVIAPMCQYSAEEGVIQPWHHQHLGHLAQSGAGLLIVEASAVSPEGRITDADAGIWNDRTREAWAGVLQSIRRYSPMPIAIQLGHAGRKASTEKPWHGGQAIAPDQPHGWQTLAPSAMAYAEGDPVPVAMTSEQIDQVIDDFVAAAERAVEAGFDAIELHAAHGYLMHQFLSPLSNHRDDQYGGSAENRMRLPLQVFDAVKAVLPEHIALGVRISAVDWAEGGLALEQSVALAKALDERGCHFIHVSSGGLTEHQRIKVEPNYQVPFAEEIKAAVDMPVIAVGLITEPEQAEAILTTSKADAIAIARGILYDPRWPWHAAAALGDTVKAAPQYLRCQPHGLSSLLVRYDEQL
ncbi:oxidoreductase [Terasakiispira papahanaumokuakeensis]|uniref:Oxidoreductase n=1 Tax=Terasakiispira papahanaumokuakeensis TaxID=197479 RepID=A0A1E2V7V3_9GAMM|nr:NADH:flavin oxidoreductase/NADH oxidase [Terasakiispira papahanaumokuakeensis]ODC03067.1 oxidoreductase [Terasakiispira papahanaumokuakeensis]